MIKKDFISPKSNSDSLFTGHFIGLSQSLLLEPFYFK